MPPRALARARARAPRGFSASSVPPSPPLRSLAQVVATKNGPMVQLDTAAKCVLAPIKFVDFLAQELKVSPRALTPKLLKDRRAGHQLTRDGQSLKFTAPHCKRVYRLRGIAETRCDETYFEMTDKATGETERITVWDFFMRNFPDHMRSATRRARPPCAARPGRRSGS